MRFFRTNVDPNYGDRKNICYLINDNWDDFTFKTSFYAVIYDQDGVRHDLGGLRILNRAFKGGRVPLPDYFEELNDQWCSLGAERDYYLNLADVGEPTASVYLKAIRDCVFDRTIFDAFKDEEGMQASLLRTVSRRDVLESFPKILRGDSQLTPYEFAFKFSTGSSDKIEKCEFAIKPDSRPPTNVHVLIGRNGVGKTRVLAGMADALTENKLTSIGVSGQFEFTDKSNEFLNIIVVSYSAFDRFDPITADRRRSDSSIPYHYIGIKKHIDVTRTDGVIEEQIALKTADDFNQEFSAIFQTLTDSNSPRYNEQRYRRWTKALDVLRSDPGLADFTEEPSDGKRALVEIFPDLSSGHKIVLLTIARLVENVSDRSLVIIDEPETHLHPPLLGSLIRAISELLISQNGVAIIATHSPVVLQEIPARCVSVISTTGDRIRIRRPKTETFGENVGMLTRKIFGLEVTQSGFYRMLKEAAQARDFDEVIKDFGEEIGGEGRALARVFTSEEDKE